MHTIGVLNIAGELRQEYIDSLKKEQYQVVPIDSEQKLDEKIRQIDGVIIFDENQENVGGVCNLILSIKKESQALVWTASKNISSINRLVYLQLGVSGNIEQKCDPEELRLIIRNSLGSEKKEDGKQTGEENLNFAIQLNSANQSVSIEGQEEIDLTRMEFQILNVLYENRGKAMSYEEIHAEIWGENQVPSKARIANLIFHLRKKIERDMLNLRYIKTVRSKGYMLNVPT
ncbi:winged helix-turn-helix transcriptional regulator [Enterococcus sp. BWR-S5]|uniref:winged helix-turn-helix transcriptional regulator n=1 Tax=Enterococcus sp. BWR-S5 TaxID=2787714 RepID=UPI00192103E1|nr:response regulator transcription factor [Enterococcus sp. BWR-S5]MBL1226780.1 response regulator transcription factor [Enterococcus sp. BWR-S5]